MPPESPRQHKTPKPAEAAPKPAAPEQAKAQLLLGKLKGTGHYGEGSALFLKRTRFGEQLRKGENAVALGFLNNFGPVAGALNFFGSYIGGKVHTARKRKQVMAMLRAHAEAQPSEVAERVFAVSRFLLQNHEHRGTPIHDSKIETEIYRFFGKITEKDAGFTKAEPHNLKMPLDDYGKIYFRGLVRANILSNFRFLAEHYTDSNRRYALEFAMLGEHVKGPEKADERRIEFVASIFGKEVKEINRAYSIPSQRQQVFDALIGIQAKAKQLLESQEERNSFYRQVCDYYSVKPETVDEFAFGFYKRTMKRLKRGGRYTDGLKYAEDLCRQIRTAYGERLRTELGTERPVTIGPPRFILPAGTALKFRPTRK